ncbi:FG-GAP repeat-containing protein [Candidatus Magnetobacterium bavaricum]|uniref:FG-GAP repeat-containing protein n=1 Tax=Candidatus Magnetobacterium bavaricum TaxID=29290 RepID=A0A0F3GXT0_9BACT|nr:FG-GAP repeat-containing protein [Candidatus Magnetobacterium bavaricum]
MEEVMFQRCNNQREKEYLRFHNAFGVRVLLTLALIVVIGGMCLSGAVDAFAEDDYKFVTKWGSQGAGDGQFRYPFGVAVDTSGNVYTTNGNGNGGNSIQVFSSIGVFITRWGSYGSNDGQFIAPYGVAVDASGNVYVADSVNNRIQKLSSKGDFITKWNSGIAGGFYAPCGVAVDASGNVYVADTDNNRIQKFAPSTGSCTYTISPTSKNFPSGGGTDSVSVTANTTCSWTASSNAGWITINSGSFGIGNGTVSYTVAANTGTTQLTGSMTIAGQTFTVTQDGQQPSQYTITATAGTGGSISCTPTSVTSGGSSICTITPNSGYNLSTLTDNGTDVLSNVKNNTYTLTNITANHTIAASFSTNTNGQLIAWYPFNGNANDDSGNGNNGVVHGATLTTDRAGSTNSAYSFNGADSYIGVPDKDGLTLGANPFTIATWVYFNQVNPQSPFVAHDEGGGGTNKWIFWYDEQGSGNASSGPALRFHVNGTALTPTDAGYASWQPNKSQWYHVAVTRSGDSYNFYVDGVMIGASKNSTVIPNPAAELTIGRAEALYLNGSLDDVRLYKRALSATEIQALSRGKTKKTRHDFNGDGNSDVLWRNTKTGDVYIWLMDGKSITGGNFVVKGVSLDWDIKAVGDFNGDDKSDVLWQNTAGDVYMWLIDGTTIQTGGYAVKGMPNEWMLTALGDFNGDGKDDMMWRDTNSGDIYVWLMDGTNITSGGYIIRGMRAEWVVKAVADLDSDGKNDVLWQNTTTGDVAAWLMDGLTMSSGNYVDKAIPSSWHIKAVEDFDGDGKADILWRESISGDVAIWFMNGVSRTSGGFVARGVPDNWQLLATGDYNGDGKADLLWQDTSKGDVYIWLMDGVKIAGGGFVVFGLSSDWQPK